jgi:mitochondrial fission protein ELM1
MNPITINWLIGGAAALLIAAACNLDGPPDYSGDYRDAEAIEAQQQEEAAQASRDFVAHQVCGPNSGYQWTDDKTLQCFTKRGAKTKTAQVQL